MRRGKLTATQVVEIGELYEGGFTLAEFGCASAWVRTPARRAVSKPAGRSVVQGSGLRAPGSGLRAPGAGRIISLIDEDYGVVVAMLA